MPTEATLPPIWQALMSLVHYVQRVNDTEYCASCPNCGGAPHQDGEWPDRFRIFCDSHPTAWCRRCGHLLFPDKLDGDPPSAEDLERWRQEQEARELARKRSAELALANLRSERLWEQYHEQMDERARDYWLCRGVPRFYQDWWQLGWCASRRFYWNGEPFITSTATIPLADATSHIVSMKHRLQTFPDGAGKYRYDAAHLPHAPFLCNPDNALTGHVIAVEGEIKAMVTHITLDDGKACVLGMPGLTPGPTTIDALANADRITLIVDPGARMGAWKLTGQLGRERCRVLIPAQKIDDGILASKMDKHDLQYLIRNALPVAA